MLLGLLIAKLNHFKRPFYNYMYKRC